jgi:ABC-type branched-subunit amino acid transport system ATPase component
MATMTDTAVAPLLDVRDVSVVFGGFRAVDHVSLTVNPGEIVGVIGPNGAGKTTLMNAIFGVYKVATGSVNALGRDLKGLSADRRASLGFARTFQNLELFHSMTVYENILTHADASDRHGGHRGRAWTRRAEHAGRRTRSIEILEELDLLHLASRTVSELSYAERKLAEFARAMVADIQLVLLDEPTAGVALEERREVIDRMHVHMRDRKIAAVVVEHDMSVIKTLSDRVYVLDGGQMLATGTFDEVVANPRVREAYLG